MAQHLPRPGPGCGGSISTAPGPDNVYQIVTQRILDALRSGVVPWRKPWRGREHSPCNAVSGRPYHGINLFLLSLAPYGDHRWLTFLQAGELGGFVRKGERATIAVFWKRLEAPESEDGTERATRSIPLLRYYHLFNVEQCDGLRLRSLPELEHRRTGARIEEAERTVRGMPSPPRIVEGGQVACYQPDEDLVSVPKIGAFESTEAYYATLFHELGHATGHVSRLNRPGVTGRIVFGSCDYSREELVAELTSAFLCAEVGIDNSMIDNSAGYIGGWLHALSGDQRTIVAASSQAQRAASFILPMTDLH